MTKNLQGHLLIATPDLLDPNFKQTVVLIVQSNNDGAFGVTLNRVSDKRVGDLWESVFPGETLENPTAWIHLGGPVFGPLMMLHTRKELSDQEIFQGLYFTTKKEYVEEIVTQDIRPYKLFLGHSGWGPGQLQREITEGSWFLLPGGHPFVFDQDNDIWQISLRIVGRHQLARILRRNDLPDDPTVN